MRQSVREEKLPPGFEAVMREAIFRSARELMVRGKV